MTSSFPVFPPFKFGLRGGKTKKRFGDRPSFNYSWGFFSRILLCLWSTSGAGAVVAFVCLCVVQIWFPTPTVLCFCGKTQRQREATEIHLTAFLFTVLLARQSFPIPPCSYWIWISSTPDSVWISAQLLYTRRKEKKKDILAAGAVYTVFHRVVCWFTPAVLVVLSPVWSRAN